MNVKRGSLFPLFLAACCCAPGGVQAARTASASFSDVSGVYGGGSGYMVSSGFEQDGSLQELAVSTQQSAGFSQRSGKLSFSPFPAAVSDLTLVIVSSHGLRATWTAPALDISRTSGPAERYILRYTTAGFIDSGAGFSAAAPFAQTWVPLGPGAAESRLLEGFSAGTTYYFALEAVNGHGLRSELSNPAAAFALVPLAPVNFKLARAGNSITMTWVPPAGFRNRIPFNDRLSPAYPYEIRKYEVYRATAPSDTEWAFLGETSSSTLSWTDVIGANDSFYYHARAVNQAGPSAPSGARSSAGGGLYFTAPDDQSLLEVPAEAAGSFVSDSADPMASYSVEISTRQEDLAGRVLKSVELLAYRGGLEPDPRSSCPGTAR